VSDDWFATAVDAVMAGKGLASVLEEPEPIPRPAAPARAVLYLSGGRAITFVLDSLRRPPSRLRPLSWEERQFHNAPPRDPVPGLKVCNTCGQVEWPAELAPPAPSAEAQRADAERVADAAVAVKIAGGQSVTEADVRHCSKEFMKALMDGAGLLDKRDRARKSLRKIARSANKTGSA
jgi:hypothetical protein